MISYTCSRRCRRVCRVAPDPPAQAKKAWSYHTPTPIRHVCWTRYAKKWVRLSHRMPNFVKIFHLFFLLVRFFFFFVVHFVPEAGGKWSPGYPGLRVVGTPDDPFAVRDVREAVRRSCNVHSQEAAPRGASHLLRERRKQLPGESARHPGTIREPRYFFFCMT